MPRQPLLQEMEDAGLEPPVALLESCVQRAERQGDEAAIKRLMDALELQAYKIIGAAAKVLRMLQSRLDAGYPVQTATK